LILTVPAHTNGLAQLSLSSALTGQEVTWTQVTGDDMSVANVAVSPDGRWATFSRGQLGAAGTEADLYLLNLATGQSQQLTQEPGYEGMATWVPSQAQQSGKGGS
jgi:Tol biopolymer transport system component